MEKRCFNCMELLDQEVCSNCGFKNENEKDGETVLKERYQMGNIFSKSLDSTVYIAYDNALCKKVLVREFTGEGILELAKNHSVEELSGRFLNYAKVTATISLCDILPRTVDTFTENGKAYWVTDYFDGKNLKELLNSGIKISYSNAIKIANQLLKGLKAIHNSGSVFGRISPETVYILKNGEVRLFGMGCGFYGFTDDLDLRVEFINPSYSAPELFEQNANVGVYSDVYSVAAILYRIITGKIPAIGFLRKGGDNLIHPGKVDKSIPKNIENALLNALNWQTEKRTQTPEAFLTELSSKKVKRKLSGGIIWAEILGFFQGIYDKSASKKNKPSKTEEPEEESDEKAKIPLLWLWITIPVVILIGLIVVLIVLFPPTSTSNEETSSASTESEDIWYYGSGNETPNNNPSYFYGGNSSKKPVSSEQNRPQNNTSINPNAVECPDLAGYSLSQARAVIQNNYLVLGDIIYEYSNDYPTDFVMEQSLKSGGMVEKGSRISLVVCKGPIPVELPELSGMEMQKALSQLRAAGFSNIKCNFVLSDGAPGTVTDLSFQSEEGATKDSTVILTISGEEVEVADYLDKTVAQMKAIAGDFTFEFKMENGNPLPENADLNAYTVVSQSAEKGMKAYKGMTIVVTVVTFND